MPRTDLTKAYTYRGKIYGPGQGVTVPDHLLEILQRRGAAPEPAYEETHNPDYEPEETGGALFIELAPRTSDALYNAGYSSEARIRSATDEELIKVPGVGKATVKRIRELLSDD